MVDVIDWLLQSVPLLKAHKFQRVSGGCISMQRLCAQGTIL